MNKKGAVMLTTAFMVMLALFLFASATLSKVMIGQRAIDKEANRKKALYIAEAGITQSLWKLDNDTDWSDSTPLDYNDILADGEYAVVFTSRSSNAVQFQSAGTVSGMTRTVKVKVKR